MTSPMKSALPFLLFLFVRSPSTAAQSVRTNREAKMLAGYAHVFSGARSFDQVVTGASVRWPTAGRFHFEPEFTYTLGQGEISRNGVAKVVFDLRRIASGAPYLTGGFGWHSSGSPRDHAGRLWWVSGGDLRRIPAWLFRRK